MAYRHHGGAWLLTGALAFAAPLAAASASAPGSWQPYVQARAWAASDVVPVKDIDGDWGQGFSPRNGRNVALARARAEVGVARGAWQLGWEYRQEATLVSDRETLEFVRLYKQRAKPAAAADYQLAARLQRWSAQGPRLARWFGAADSSLPRVQLAAALYTRATLRDTRVSGSVHYAPLDQYDFKAERSDTNSADRYPFMGDDPVANGASVSLAMDWQATPQLALNARVDDLWSAMRWKHLPLKEDRIDSRVSAIDADGYINYRPLLSGSNRQISSRAALGRSGQVQARYDLGMLTLTGGVERVAGTTIPSVGLAHQFGWGTLSTQVDTRFGSVGVGLDTGRVQLALQSDNVRPGRAHALGLSVGMRY